MKTLAVLSGKGGVGKSSITASLALALSKQRKIICADCDVDASNLALIFGINDEDYAEWNSISTNQKAIFDLKKCNSCGKCAETCYFRAISWKDNKPALEEFGCEGCGACEIICPQKAIELVDVKNAKIGYADSGRGFRIVSAQLGIGQSGSGKVVFEARKKAKELAEDAEIMLMDSSAGIGCPVIASVTGSDFAVLVTEPTPSGFSDFKRALDVIKHFNIPFGAVINKFDLDETYSETIRDFVEKNNGTLLMKIPYDRTFADALVNMVPIAESSEKYRDLFDELAENLLRRL